MPTCGCRQARCRARLTWSYVPSTATRVAPYMAAPRTLALLEVGGKNTMVSMPDFAPWADTAPRDCRSMRRRASRTRLERLVGGDRDHPVLEGKRWGWCCRSLCTGYSGRAPAQVVGPGERGKARACLSRTRARWEAGPGSARWTGARPRCSPLRRPRRSPPCRTPPRAARSKLAHVLRLDRVVPAALSTEQGLYEWQRRRLTGAANMINRGRRLAPQPSRS